MSAIDMTVNPEDVGYAILNGLPPSYEPLILGLEGRGGVISMEAVMQALRNDALRKNNRVKQMDNSKSSETAMYTNDRKYQPKQKKFKQQTHRAMVTWDNQGSKWVSVSDCRVYSQRIHIRRHTPVH